MSIEKLVQRLALLEDKLYHMSCYAENAARRAVEVEIENIEYRLKKWSMK